MTCIYKITNKINNKVYIGSSKNIKKRKWEHFHQLKKDYHHSEHLQKAYNKYGFENFTFEIVENCLNSCRKEREIYYIAKFDSANRDFGYNINDVDENGFKCSEETKLKISKAHTSKTKNIKMYQVINEKLIGIFDSCAEIYRQYNIHTAITSEILRKKRKSYKGYTFCYEDEKYNYISSPKQRDMTKYYK
jgi:predicted GIY-YIG superfamily endonuclease